jgi:hypothetical protein
MLGLFERSERRFPRDRGKSLQKIFQSFPTFEVIEQVLDRYSCSPKHGNSTQDPGVFDDYAILGIYMAFQFVLAPTQRHYQFSAKGGDGRNL